MFNPESFELVTRENATLQPLPVEARMALPVYRVQVVCERTLKQRPGALTTVKAMADVLREELSGMDREKLVCLMLNARLVPMGLEVISIGTLTASLAHPREIFKAAIIKGCMGIVLAHNHPSGDCSPSEEDRRLTKRVADGGRLLGIELFDHLVLSEDGCYSFKSEGLL